MGMDVGSRRVVSKPGASGSRHRRAPMSEINVTPLVDVMLVLLIVFMVTAPLLTVGVPINLPEAAANRIIGQDEPLVISINKKGSFFLQDTEIKLDQLVPRLTAITQNRKGARIFLRGDRNIAYGQVMSVMGALNKAGFNSVSLITQMPRKNSNRGTR